MRVRRPTRNELRELGDGLLMIAEFIGLLIFIVGAFRYVAQTPTLLDAIVAGACVLAFVYRRFNPRPKGDR